MVSESFFLAPAALFALTVFFGFRLSGAGKPYNGILFNIHKLIALGLVVLAGIQLSNTADYFDAFILFVLLIPPAVISVVVLFVSGGLMSAGKLDQKLMLAIHRAGSITAVIAAAFLVYQLLN